MELVHKNGIFGFRLKNFGGILIEFAFSVPVLVILLYFVHDHYVFNGYKNKIRTSAYLAASMIQQISNTRTNKKLTTADLSQISYCSFYNLFTSRNDMLSIKYSFEPVIYYLHVKRINSNSYSCQCIFWLARSGYDACQYKATSTRNLNVIKKISPNLECSENGDERLLIWLLYWLYPSRTSKSKMGFFLLPISLGANISTTNIFDDTYISQINKSFNYQLVITPKPGLFPI